ncbi:transcriptional regulator, ArsR family [Modicisalibacter muralis]|uniref:Transcriptional regulator, ArsR family n=1 Tax=Modicisalibacter muralis TaxID=119000 RepID=A0A1G9M6E4_9GAMM|nr:metalloregulator ArsR/SmtB family transcription factor [Halomonas muralis]SDL69537.1 transcriptional regulator, ArsR family [Halomonas muralis]
MSRPSATVAKRDPVPVFAALGDTNRLMLVLTLRDGQSRSISRLTSDFRMSRQAITKHLHVLEQAGIVRSRRVGRENHFSYVPEPIEDVRSYLDRVCEEWDDALSRLKSFVED